MLKKIVILGPESTGKSTLCELLASHYKTLWCPEYAREYLLTNGAAYTYDDLLTIAKGQVSLEDECINRSVSQSRRALSHSPVFIDTNMYVMKVWCEYVFDKCHRYILDQIVERKYDLYLLCNIDLPWAPDPLREYPELEKRKELFSIYKDIMINQDSPWAEISGNYQQRMESAVRATDHILGE
jgi:NadR type nicotinamide-nucleotide adenylyltransferase